MDVIIKNKRILIAQPLIHGINGSTVVTFELAKALQEYGAKVTVYTCDYDNPAKKLFVDNHITVDIAQNNPQYSLDDFDYIWTHSQILPLSIIEALSNKLPKKLPAFIFLHMSGMEWIPDEKPWIYDLENKLSSLSLFISEEVLEINNSMLSQTIPKAFFRNPSPKNYYNRNNKPSPKLKKVLIVSNHPPHEILEAKDILSRQYGIKVTSLGENQDNYTLISPNIIEDQDAIITIAKTVPYCLVSGTPVYVYDAFGGGPGWLNEQNFEKAKQRNFSGYQNHIYPNYVGKGFHPKNPEQIAKEIIEGYKSSLSFHQKHRKEFQKEFGIDTVLPNIFSQIKPRDIKSFSKPYANAVKLSERFAITRFELGGLSFNNNEYIKSLKTTQKNLESQNADLALFKEKAEAVFNSKAYQLFEKTIKPYKKLKGRINNEERKTRKN